MAEKFGKMKCTTTCKTIRVWNAFGTYANAVLGYF